MSLLVIISGIIGIIIMIIVFIVVNKKINKKYNEYYENLRTKKENDIKFIQKMIDDSIDKIK